MLQSIANSAPGPDRKLAVGCQSAKQPRVCIGNGRRLPRDESQSRSKRFQRGKKNPSTARTVSMRRYNMAAYRSDVSIRDESERRAEGNFATAQSGKDGNWQTDEANFGGPVLHNMKAWKRKVPSTAVSSAA